MSAPAGFLPAGVKREGGIHLIFGKHINVYYRKYALALLTGLLALFTVDYLQLKIPEIYQLVINGLNQGYILENGVQIPFDTNFMLDRICMPMVSIILAIVFGRFLWRVTIFGAATKVETDLRNKMFRHAEDLSREYYQVNKVGNLMSLFTNDLDPCRSATAGASCSSSTPLFCAPWPLRRCGVWTIC